MDRDRPPPLRARVRWANVARASALAGLAALIVAWPQIRPAAPMLPPLRPVPVTPEPEPAVAPPRRRPPAQVTTHHAPAPPASVVTPAHGRRHVPDRAARRRQHAPRRRPAFSRRPPQPKPAAPPRHAPLPRPAPRPPPPQRPAPGGPPSRRGPTEFDSEFG